MDTETGEACYKRVNGFAVALFNDGCSGSGDREFAGRQLPNGSTSGVICIN